MTWTFAGRAKVVGAGLNGTSLGNLFIDSSSITPHLSTYTATSIHTNNGSPDSTMANVVVPGGVAVVPEPGSMALFGTGRLAALVVPAWKQRKRKASANLPGESVASED